MITQRFTFLIFAAFLLIPRVNAQTKQYSHADSLKGSYSPARSWWDVQHYELHVTFSPSDSTIAGHNRITYKVLESANELQLDLMQPLILDSVLHQGKKCILRQDGNAYFVQLITDQKKDAVENITAFYHGRPVQAKQPPWDGGLIWSKDPQGNPWISIACQGMAAQVWYPNKDHMADEPDSASMFYTVPSGLFVVSNGRFSSVVPDENGNATFSWKVHNPINNYNIIPYIGKYTVLKDTFNGKGGMLDLEFWVLQGNHEAAQKQFTQVKPMLRCFEGWFGKYPFYSDGYKLVEAPFLGMEHQSAIAYGNGFMNGYHGRDLSGTGWGLKWDFIIVHESGHEWFGNNISAADVADNWIHESFTAYAENLFTECLHGKEAGAAYVRGTRMAIENDKPIISDYNVNAGGSLDLYYKGANMLHTIRQFVSSDSTWKAMLTGLNNEFYHKTVSSQQIEEYMKRFLGLDLQKVFDQYLRTTQVPVLEYKMKKNKVAYRWSNCIKGFNMPVGISTVSGTAILRPTGRWQRARWTDTTFVPDANYYITSIRIK